VHDFGVGGHTPFLEHVQHVLGDQRAARGRGLEDARMGAGRESSVLVVVDDGCANINEIRQNR
jgi:hypothetical protein